MKEYDNLLPNLMLNKEVIDNAHLTIITGKHYVKCQEQYCYTDVSSSVATVD